MREVDSDQPRCEVCGATPVAVIASRLAPFSFGVCARCHREGLEPSFVILAALGVSQRRLAADPTRIPSKRIADRVLRALWTRTVEDGTILRGYATRAVRDHVETRDDTVARAGVAALTALEEGLITRDQTREVVAETVTAAR